MGSRTAGEVAERTEPHARGEFRALVSLLKDSQNTHSCPENHWLPPLMGEEAEGQSGEESALRSHSQRMPVQETTLDPVTPSPVLLP